MPLTYFYKLKNSKLENYFINFSNAFIYTDKKSSKFDHRMYFEIHPMYSKLHPTK